MSALKFTLSDVTSFLPDNLPGLKKNYSDLRQSLEFRENEQMQMVFLEVAIESLYDWDLKPRLLNSVQTLKPTELSYVYIYVNIYTYIYIFIHT